MPHRSLAHRPAIAAPLVAMLGVAIGVSMAAARSSESSESSESMTVTGGSVETVRFTAQDLLRGLASHLTGGEDTDPSKRMTTLVEHGAHANPAICYALSGEVIVASNTSYDLLVSGDSPHPGLRFMPDAPTDFAACEGGEPVSDSMFDGSEPAGAWVLRQPRTQRQSYPFTLSLLVHAGADPLEVLAASSFSIVARPTG